MVLLDEGFKCFGGLGFFLKKIVHGVFISSFDFYSGAMLSIYLIVKLMTEIIKIN